MSEVQWNAEKLRQAGIDPCLQNYLLMVLQKGCDKCPLFDRCITAKQRDRIHEDYILRCPVYILNITDIEKIH